MGRMKWVVLAAAMVAVAAGCKALKATESAQREEAAKLQQVVRFGKHEVKPELNVFNGDTQRQEAYAAAWGTAVNGVLNVLMQFARIPDTAMRSELESLGARLGGYVGGNAYYAQVPAGTKPHDFAKAGAIAVVPIEPMWKVSNVLLGTNLPEWVDRGGGQVEVVFSWFPNVDAAFVKRHLAQRRCKVVNVSESFSTATVVLPQREVMDLAAEQWVQHVGPVAPPMELFDEGGVQRPGNPRGVDVDGLRKRRLGPVKKD